MQLTFTNSITDSISDAISHSRTNTGAYSCAFGNSNTCTYRRSDCSAYSIADSISDAISNGATNHTSISSSDKSLPVQR